MQLGWFLFGPPNIFRSSIKEIVSSANSKKKLFGKELMNKDPIEIDSTSQELRT